jgi:CheY-like chemotaxis protein
MPASLSVLIVDDDPSMASALADVLQVKGFDVHTAPSGGAALEVLQRASVDVLLTDVRMADMDGLALYRQVRRSHPHLTTILMTAYAADELIQKGMAEGIKTVLTKPIDNNFLLTLLHAIKKISKKNA